jgi:hypothetical protein
MYNPPTKFFPSLRYEDPVRLSSQIMTGRTEDEFLPSMAHSPTPTRIHCRKCHKEDLTRSERKCGDAATKWTAVLFFLSCGLCVCWPAFCCCGDSTHYCRHCGTVAGFYKHPFLPQRSTPTPKS